MKIILFLTRLIVGYIGLSSWIFGCCLLIYVVWSLNTITSIQSIASGESLITTSQILFGSLLSLKGLIGMYGAWKKHTYFLKLFLFLILFAISSEIGTFISLKVANTRIPDLVEQGWKEINAQSRNYIQKELKCCGLTGLSEFASKLDPIDESCYEQRRRSSLSSTTTTATTVQTTTGSSSSSSSIRPSRYPTSLLDTVDDNNIANTFKTSNNKQPFRVGCKPKLIDWLSAQTKTFIIMICSLLGLQIFSVIMVLLLLKLLQTIVDDHAFKQLQMHHLKLNNPNSSSDSSPMDDTVNVVDLVHFANDNPANFHHHNNPVQHYYNNIDDDHFVRQVEPRARRMSHHHIQQQETILLQDNIHNRHSLAF